MNYRIKNNNQLCSIKFPEYELELDWRAKHGAIKCKEIIQTKQFKFVVLCNDNEWKTFIKTIKKDKTLKYKKEVLKIENTLSEFFDTLYSGDTKYIFNDYSNINLDVNSSFYFEKYKEKEKSIKHYNPEYRDYLTDDMQEKAYKRYWEIRNATSIYKPKFSLKSFFQNNWSDILHILLLIIGICTFLIPIIDFNNPYLWLISFPISLICFFIIDLF